jgi:hypothetical protein
MDDAQGKEFGINPDLRKDYASLSIVKNNYGPTGDSFWLKRTLIESHSVSVLEHVNLTIPAQPLKGGDVLQKRILTKIAMHQGKYSKRGFIDAHTGSESNLKATKRAIKTALDDLIANGEVILKAPSPELRKQLTLHHTIKETLHLNIL